MVELGVERPPVRHLEIADEGEGGFDAAKLDEFERLVRRVSRPCHRRGRNGLVARLDDREAAYDRLEKAMQGVSDALEQMAKTFADMAIKLKERK